MLFAISAAFVSGIEQGFAWKELGCVKVSDLYKWWKYTFMLSSSFLSLNVSEYDAHKKWPILGTFPIPFIRKHK